MRETLKRGWAPVVIAALAAGCGYELETAEGEGAQGEIGAACVFSFDCSGGLVCSDDEGCIDAPSIELARTAFEPNPGFDFDLEALPDVVQASSTDSTATPVDDSEAARADLRARLSGGVSAIEVRTSAAQEFLAIDQEFSDLVFPQGDNSVLVDAIRTAYFEHTVLRNAVLSGEAARGTIASFAQIHRSKLRARETLDKLLRSLEALNGLGYVTDTCEFASDTVLDPQYGEKLEAREPFLFAGGFTHRLQNCLYTASDILDAIDHLGMATTPESVIPVQAMRDAIRDLEDGYLGNRMEAGSHRRSFGEGDADGGAYIRARELMYAISLYGTTAYQAAQTSSMLYPFTDMEVEFQGKTAPLGEFAIAAESSDDANVSIALLAIGLVAQNKYLRDLVTDFKNKPATLEELIPLTTVTTRLLETAPDHQALVEKIIDEQVQAGKGRFWTSLGIGVGCGGATLSLTWISGPWAIPVAVGAGILCGVDFHLAHQDYKRSKVLYELSRTLRYFGVSDSLQSFEELKRSKADVTLSKVFMWASAIGAVADAVTIGRAVIGGLKAIKATRNLMSWTNLFRTSFEEWIPRYMSKRFPRGFSRWLDSDQVRVLASQGRVWFYHTVDHTNEVYRATTTFLNEALARGLVDEHDVLLGKVAALFHDSVQRIDSVGDGWLINVKRATGTNEILSADFAEQWMRSMEGVLFSSEQIDADILRVRRAIIEGTTVSFTADHALVPQLLASGNATRFFMPDGKVDLLPLALALADFAPFGGYGDNVVRRIINSGGAVLIEENPGIVTEVLVRRGANPTRQAEALDKMRKSLGFQQTLYQGRHWVATQSWLDVLPANKVEGLSDAIHAAFPAFAEDPFGPTFRALQQASSNAADAPFDEVVNTLLGGVPGVPGVTGP